MSSIDSTQLRVQILERFGDIEDDLVSDCVRICRTYNLQGEDLFYKWEAMCFGMHGTFSLLNKDVIPALKAKCQSDLGKASAAGQKLRANPNGPLSRGFGGGLGRTAVARLDASATSRTPAKSSIKRHDGFGVAMGEDRKLPLAGPSKVRFVGPKGDEASRKKRAYRYMYETAADRGRALDRRIDEFGQLVKEHYNIEELGDPAAGTEEEVVVVGRITHDSETHSVAGKLNEASIVLESSRQMGSGARVPLQFGPNVKIRNSKLAIGGTGLFPGAIAAFKGRNGGGGWFLVSEILALPPLPAYPRSEVKTENAEPFSMYVACGPFTPDADLKYGPWRELLVKIKEEKPTVVLLLGPFVDSVHPAVKCGEVEATPAEIFREQFLWTLQDFLNVSPDSIVLVLPSVRDIISDHAVFPQCELGPEFAIDPRIHLLPNPARFSVNGVTFAVSSIDVLFHLRREEFFMRAEDVRSTSTENDDSLASDAMGNTCRHLLQQRSFYPLFPVPFELSQEVNVDVSHSEELDLGDAGEEEYAPDVLITPSRLKHFSKILDSTVAVNPSFLTKGTFATLMCGGSESDTSVRNRVSAEILRLGKNL